jgi:hypothetical protein
MRVDEVVDRSVKRVQDDAKFSEGAQQCVKHIQGMM